MSYLKPPPRELLFRIHRNCSNKDTALIPNSLSIKKASNAEIRNEDNSRSYLSESGSSSSNQGGEGSDNEGSDYETRKRKTKKTSTVKKLLTSTKASSLLALKES
jgi:hypothetical protein